MKIRTGFVSNSSSSSYTCDVSGVTESGWDASASDCGMLECVNGHVFSDDYALSPSVELTREEKLDMIKREYGEYYDPEEWEHLDDDELEDKWRDEREEVVREIDCPICSFKNVKIDDAYRYLMIRQGLTEDMLLGELKDRFKNHAAYAAYLKEHEDGIKPSR